MAFRLVSSDGDQVFELKRGAALTVGRALSSDVALLDPTVSRRHASLVADVPGIGGPAVVFENQARFDPVAYLQVLASRIPGDGAYLVEGAEVTRVEDRPLAT